MPRTKKHAESFIGLVFQLKVFPDITKRIKLIKSMTCGNENYLVTKAIEAEFENLTEYLDKKINYQIQ